MMPDPDLWPDGLKPLDGKASEQGHQQELDSDQG